MPRARGFCSDPHHTTKQPHLLLVVGDDAADEVGVGVPQRGHEFGQLLLVQLPHRAEHALARLEGPGHCRLRHASHLVQANDAVHWREQARAREYPAVRARAEGRDRQTGQTVQKKRKLQNADRFYLEHTKQAKVISKG